jgi:uroporphyrinogen decarboxylase
MTGLERVLAAVRCAHAGIPAVPQIFGHAARTGDMPLRRYLTDPAVLAQCQIAAMERYATDAVFALFDASVETEALGSRLRLPKDSYPIIERYVLERASDAARLQLPDPRRAGRMPVALEAVRLLRCAVGDRALVAGCVLGPMTLACQLMGAEPALFAAIDETAAFEQVLDFSVELALCFGTAQLEAGAHLCIVFEPSASPAMVPPAFFRGLLKTRLRRLCEGLKHQGALATWLHIAGPVEPILPYYPDCGVDIANIDYCVDPVRARAAVPDLCLAGNIRPMAFLDSGPEVITEACTQVLSVARRGILLSSGCEIPLDSRPECVHALVRAARNEAVRP